MKTIIFSLILIVFLFSCKDKKKPSTDLITLSNGTIEISILPDVGGRLVRASLVGQENILNSDPSQWNESPEKRPTLDPTAPFKAYNGHITWLSPQSEWWTKQDSFPDLKYNRSNWPPDPTLTLAPYWVVGEKTGEIALVSPESPFTKVQLTKIYRIDGNTVTLTTMARNIGNDTVSWGLWHNTRMNGWDAVFVQADSTELIKTEYMNQGGTRKPELQYTKGYFTYNTVLPEAPETVYKSKSFFTAETPLIAGYHQNQWLIIRSEPLDPALVHPEQGRIEIYLENSVNPTSDLQELEMHFAYRKIAPQAFIEAAETWEILPGSGLTDKKELLEELREKLKSKVVSDQ